MLYNQYGDIQKLKVYKYEGVLESTEEQITSDKNLLKYSGLPSRQDWYLVNGVLVDEQGNTLSDIEKLSGSIYMERKTHFSILYKIE